MMDGPVRTPPKFVPTLTAVVDEGLSVNETAALAQPSVALNLDDALQGAVPNAASADALAQASPAALSDSVPSASLLASPMAGPNEGERPELESAAPAGAPATWMPVASPVESMAVLPRFLTATPRPDGLPVLRVEVPVLDVVVDPPARALPVLSERMRVDEGLVPGGDAPSLQAAPSAPSDLHIAQLPSAEPEAPVALAAFDASQPSLPAASSDSLNEALSAPLAVPRYLAMHSPTELPTLPPVAPASDSVLAMEPRAVPAETPVDAPAHLLVLNESASQAPTLSAAPQVLAPAEPEETSSFKALKALDEESALQLEDELLHRVLQRVDSSLEERLTDAVSAAVQKQLDAMIPQLRQEVESVLRELVTEALSAELCETPGKHGG